VRGPEYDQDVKKIVGGLRPDCAHGAQSQTVGTKGVHAESSQFAPGSMCGKPVFAGTAFVTTKEKLFMAQAQSLDDRRPRYLRQLAGNQSVIQRLSEQMKRGTVPNRVFLFGPTGAGKTTLARILVRHFFCEQRIGIGDPCGQCQTCRKDLSDIFEYEQWTAARLEQNWNWWEVNGRSLLGRSHGAFFIDETQDLSELHQKDFYDQLESARAMVVFATTHKNVIKDALVNRFGSNVYELRRPTVEEAADHILRQCQELKVEASRDKLIQVVEHYGCDLRKCVDFAYTAADQAPNGVVNDAFIQAVLGIEPLAEGTFASRPKRLAKL